MKQKRILQGVLFEQTPSSPVEGKSITVDENLTKTETSDNIKLGVNLNNIVSYSNLQNNFATKQYVMDEIADAIDVIGPAISLDRATTTNLTNISGLLSVDGSVVTSGMLVLVRNQTNSWLNGVYKASSSTWILQKYNDITQTWTDTGTSDTYASLNINQKRFIINSGTSLGGSSFTCGIIGITSPLNTNTSSVIFQRNYSNSTRNLFNSIISASGNDSNLFTFESPGLTRNGALNGASYPHIISHMPNGSTYQFNGFTYTQSHVNISEQSIELSTNGGQVTRNITGQDIYGANHRYGRRAKLKDTYSGLLTPIIFDTNCIISHNFTDYTINTTSAYIMELKTNLQAGYLLIDNLMTDNPNGLQPIFIEPQTNSIRIIIQNQKTPISFAFPSGYSGANVTIEIYGNKGSIIYPYDTDMVINDYTTINLRKVITNQLEGVDWFQNTDLSTQGYLIILNDESSNKLLYKIIINNTPRLLVMSDYNNAPATLSDGVNTFYKQNNKWNQLFINDNDVFEIDYLLADQNFNTLVPNDKTFGILNTGEVVLKTQDSFTILPYKKLKFNNIIVDNKIVPFNDYLKSVIWNVTSGKIVSSNKNKTFSGKMLLSKKDSNNVVSSVPYNLPWGVWDNQPTRMGDLTISNEINESSNAFQLDPNISIQNLNVLFIKSYYKIKFNISFHGTNSASRAYFSLLVNNSLVNQLDANSPGTGLAYSNCNGYYIYNNQIINPSLSQYQKITLNTRIDQNAFTQSVFGKNLNDLQIEKVYEFLI